MPDSFTIAHAFTAPWEGGFVNHPADPGGATNYGVSLRWLTGAGLDVNGDGHIDITDIRALTPQAAAGLFRSYFWDYLLLDRLPLPVAVVVYDSAVNCGCAQSLRFLQRTCNKITPAACLSEDGKLGSRTLAAVKSIATSQSREVYLAKETIMRRSFFHDALVEKSPFKNAQGNLVDYRPFARGWLARCNALQVYVTDPKLGQAGEQ